VIREIYGPENRVPTNNEIESDCIIRGSLTCTVSQILVIKTKTRNLKRENLREEII
jgi:hypothetical protein